MENDLTEVTAALPTASAAVTFWGIRRRFLSFYASDNIATPPSTWIGGASVVDVGRARHTHPVKDRESRPSLHRPGADGT